MSEFLDVEFAADPESAKPYGQYVVRKAPVVFKSGDYPDKAFSMTKDELKLAVADFARPVPLKVEHKDSIFDGKLGEFIRAEYQDGEKEAVMSGKVLIPKWLHELYADKPIPLSASWNRANKRLAHVGLVTKPRVEGAAAVPDLEAAFAAHYKSGDSYRTEHGQLALQQIHDITAHHGSLCKVPAEVEKTDSGENKSSSKDADERGSGKTRSEMSLDDPLDFAALCQAMFMHGSERDALQVIHDASSKVGAKCKFQPVKAGDVKTVLKTGTASDLTNTDSAGQRGYQFSQDDPEKQAMSAKLAEQASMIASLRADKIKAAAASFADKAILDDKAFPAERLSLIDLYTAAANDDANMGGTVDFNGGKVSRVAALEGAIAARPAHPLKRESLPANQNVQVLLSLATQESKGQASMSADRKNELLAMTPLGQAILKTREAD